MQLDFHLFPRFLCLKTSDCELKAGDDDDDDDKTHGHC